jgi:hypothetical protein
VLDGFDDAGSIVDVPLRSFVVGEMIFRTKIDIANIACPLAASQVVRPGILLRLPLSSPARALQHLFWNC